MKARPVLLIDHDSEWCEHVCRFLEPHGFDVVVAHSEAQALQTLAAGRPAAVLLDPAAVDPAFRHMLRDVPELGRVPIFVVSDAPAHAVYARGDGLTGYLRKGAALENLRFLLSDYAAGRQATAPAHVVAA